MVKIEVSTPKDGEVLQTLSAGSKADLIRLYSQHAESFCSEASMREWLTSKKVNCSEADSCKGLNKLFDKTKKGEARLVYDSHNERVVRIARAAKIAVEVTIHGDCYPLVELCQIFLGEKVVASDLLASDPHQVSELVSRLKIRSAQVRDSQQLWETLISDEDPFEGARRGLIEELGLSETDSRKVKLTIGESGLEYEPPIDWPGIPSVLEIHQALAILPEEISKPVYVELEAADQITIFVATPNGPVLRTLLGMVLPKIKYVS